MSIIHYTSQVTEDLKVIAEEDEAVLEDNGGEGSKPTKGASESPSPSRATPPLSLHPRPPLRRTPSLSKRESLMSINRQECMSPF